ncbi:porin [Pelagibaculum spongiae]|uniref:Porin domain-containing protein n=1 Tax=Pelagibaculum spongiae TaxID=2080658 RepID=A0A2V1GRE1_9GAMM|nr:porin [Pelagibaculum spongiae]PVZ67648.1 hypothetical protein DC094_14520 [Pelagibaculum spongiae]
MKTKQVFPIAAVALAVAMAAPTVSAEAQAYLSLRPTIESDVVKGGDRETKVDDYYSRFGLKGSEEFGDLTVGALGEWNANGDLGTTRYSYGWIQGSFGKIKIGKTDDVMVGNVSGMTELGWTDNASFARFSLDGHVGSGFKDDNIRYTYTADMFQADVSYRRPDSDITETNLGGQVYLGDFTIGAAYKLTNGKAGKAATTKNENVRVEVRHFDANGKPLDVNGDIITDPALVATTQAFVEKEMEVVVPVAATATNKDYQSATFAIGATYASGPLTLAGTYHSVEVEKDVKAVNNKDSSAIEVAAAYSINDKVTVDGIYTSFDDNTVDSEYGVGVSYKLASNMLIFTTYENRSFDAAGTKDTNKATIGFKFDLNLMAPSAMKQ